MGHDVYIGYDERDQEICDAICSIFEENNIAPWVKSKNMPLLGSVEDITQAITDSACFILIYSKNSRDTNYVINETDIAFSRDVPIVVFNIDDSIIDKNLEFILQTQTKISAFPDYKKQLEKLVKKTSRIIKKPSGDVKLNSEYLKTFERIDPGRRQKKVRKYVMIAVPIAIILILIYLFAIAPTGKHTTDDGSFVMNVTGVDVDGVKYTVHGESYNMPSDSVNYFMNLRFFDENGNMVYSVNSTADEFNSGIIWSGNLHDDNATRVTFRLTDMGGNVLCDEDYVIE